MLVSTCRVDQHPDLQRGYVLHLTNLEDKPYEYLVNFIMTVPSGYFPSASQVARLAPFFGEDIRIEPFRRTGSTYTAGLRLIVQPGQTTSLGLQTPWPESFYPDQVVHHIEGFVTLRLPVARNPAARDASRFHRRAQSDVPVRVLLNPETRTTYKTGGGRMDIWDDDPHRLYKGVTQQPVRTIERTEPLHVATGRAENELEPDGIFKFTADDARIAGSVSQEQARLPQGAWIADHDRAAALLELLADVGNDPAVARAFNAVLEEGGAGVRLCPPPPPAPGRKRRER